MRSKGIGCEGVGNGALSSLIPSFYSCETRSHGEVEPRGEKKPWDERFG